jgi:hypothetical protein
MEHLLQNVAKEGETEVHAARKCLHHQVLPESVHDETGQEIRFTVHKPIDRTPREEPCAQSGCAGNPFLKECSVDFLDGSREQPNGDERMGMIEPQSERFAAGIAHFHDVSCCGRSMGFPDFVAENPDMTGADAKVFILAEDNALARGRRYHGRPYTVEYIKVQIVALKSKAN